VRRPVYQRWSVVLGMIAMLGAIVSVPLAAAHALQMAASQHSQQTAAAKHDMPCHGHKPAKAKHCPNCPQKTCPDLANCLAKCLQQLTPLPIEAQLHGHMIRDGVVPAASQVSAGTLAPLLLRPPSA
jgi:hypothetical protein